MLLRPHVEVQWEEEEEEEEKEEMEVDSKSNALAALMQSATSSHFDLAKGKRDATKKHASRIKQKQKQEEKEKKKQQHQQHDDLNNNVSALQEAIDEAQVRKFTSRRQLADHDGPILAKMRIPKFLLAPTRKWSEKAIKLAERQDQDEVAIFVQDLDYRTVEWPAKKDEVAEQFEDPNEVSNRIPILRVFGWTEEGMPALVNVHGFRPYMFARVPRDVYDKHSDADLCLQLKEKLNRVLKRDQSVREDPPVTRIEMNMTESLKYHRFGMSRFFKIYVATPNLITKVRTILFPAAKKPPVKKKEEAEKKKKEAADTKDNPDDDEDETLEPFEHIDGEDEANDERCLEIWGQRRRLEVFECNIDFTLRFLFNAGCSGSQWVGLRAGKYFVREGVYNDTVVEEDEAAEAEPEEPEEEEEKEMDVMVDDDGGGGGWPRKRKRRRKADDGGEAEGKIWSGWTKTSKRVDQRLSNVEIEIDVRYEDLVPHNVNEPRWNKLPPHLRFNSMDIEAAAPAGHFPSPEEAPVTTIGMYLCDFDDIGDEKKWHAVAFTLRGCRKISEKTVVFSFDDEKEMLESWAAFVRATRPDWLTGYNIRRFDIPYLLRRAAHLKAEMFAFWTPLFESVTAELTTFRSRGTGGQQRGEIKMGAMHILDMYSVVLSGQEKLTSYTLNNVAFHYLKLTKADLHYSLLTPMTIGPQSTDDTRKTVTEYCLRDAMLPIKLMHHLKSMLGIVEMARVTGVTVAILTRRGQGVKTMSLLVRLAITEGLIKPFTVRPREEQLDEFGNEVKADHKAKIKGATVIEPKRGYYTEGPVATLDFASLYPSIMMANNLCFSTLAHPSTIDRIPKDQRVTLPISANMQPGIIKPSVKKGLIPRILENILEARKAAKKAMAEAKDETEKQIYNQRQLALKISANSVYGYCTGYDVTAKAVGAAVTWFGRQLIFFIRDLVEEKFCLKNGYPFDAEVIYGDTDSIMVYLKTEKMDIAAITENMQRLAMAAKVAAVANAGLCITVPEALKFGPEMADYCSARMRKPIKLEFEKVYHPYLLQNKKRYGGIKNVEGEPPKLDTKGGENIRRNGSPLVRQLIAQLYTLLLEKQDVPGAVKLVQDTIRNVMAGRVDLSKLVIIARISNDQYKTKPGPVRLAERMEAREPGSGPKLGDAIRYFYIRDLNTKSSKKKTKLSDQIEEATYVLQHKLQIDYERYIVRELMPAVSRVLRYPLVRDMARPMERQEVQDEADRRVQHVFDQVLHSGLHLQEPSVGTSPLGRFVSANMRCIGCRAPTQSTRAAVCPSCMHRRPELIMEHMEEVRRVEKRYCQDWTACQRCMGTFHKEISCANFDCPIHFERETLREELTNLHRTEGALRHEISW